MSMSEGDWEITDATVRTVFKVTGSVVTVRDKKFLKDPANTTLLRMQKKEGTQQYTNPFTRFCPLVAHDHSVVTGKEVFVMIWIVCVSFCLFMIVYISIAAYELARYLANLLGH
jgi:hypothetical protein